MSILEVEFPSLLRSLPSGHPYGELRDLRYSICVDKSRMACSFMLPFASSFTSIVAMAKSSFALTGAAAFAYTSIISSSASTKLHCSTDQRCQPPTSYPLVRTLQKCIWAMCLSTTLDSYVVILISFRNFANLKSNLIMTVNTPRKHNLNPGERMFSRLCLSHLPNLPPLGVSFRHISDLPIQHVPQLMNLVCFARIVCFWSGLKSFQILQEVLPQCILKKNWVEEVVQSRSPNLCALLSVRFWESTWARGFHQMPYLASQVLHPTNPPPSPWLLLCLVVLAPSAPVAWQ